MKHTVRNLVYALTAAAAILTAADSYAQMPAASDTLYIRPQLPDSADVARYSRKNFWRAAGETLALDGIVWAWDRYVANSHWAHINIKTIKKNFQEGFYWDNDKLMTNNFFHPYHGSLFFEAGRANGYNYYQSALFAVAGSTLWEMVFEDNYPSISDVIATPTGGMALGEVMFRSADLVTDDSTWGWERAWREIAGCVIAPTRGINRLLTGQMWRRSATPGRIYGIPELSINVGFGAKMLVSTDSRSYQTSMPELMLDVEYGDRFAEKTTRPYDYFTLHSELHFNPKQPLVGNLEISGRLWGSTFMDKPHDKMNIGIYQNYDLCDSDSIPGVGQIPFKYALPTAVAATWMYRRQTSPETRFDAYASAVGVPLACVVSDHYQAQKRDYNYASGFGIKAGVSLLLGKGMANISLDNKFLGLYTWKGYDRNVKTRDCTYRQLNVMGDNSQAYVSVTDFRLDMRLWRQLYATFMLNHYYRFTHYRDFPSGHASEIGVHLLVSWLF